MDHIWRYLLLLSMVAQIRTLTRLDAISQMKCSYGERGSLTATCVNATPEFFKTTPYRFDHLDETLRCENCRLEILTAGTFDLSGNQILHLDLQNGGIKSIRPRAFVGLVFLEDLILSHNDIDGIVPGTFSGVKKIITVKLDHNSINVLYTDGFLELINLRVLDLHKNNIKGVTRGAFNGLKSITELDLSDNRISDVKDIFNNLTTLQTINLNNNDISALNGNEFENLTSLLQITFAHNKIASIPLLEFSMMNELMTLDLSFNLINDISAGSFSGLHSLEDLNLSHNIIKEVPRRGFHSLHDLHSLDLSFNSLTTFQTSLYSSGLPDLRSLNLSHNQITSVEVTGIFSLPNLHSLDLSWNRITDFDYKRLISRLPRISLLGLTNNRWPCYLQKEMNEYFAEDNFKFVLYDTAVNTSNCTDTPNRHPTYKENYAEELIGQSPDRVAYASLGHAATIWVFTLISIILVLIALLSYSQYRLYKVLRQPSMEHATSQVQLISSDLESRSNDYLKE